MKKRLMKVGLAAFLAWSLFGGARVSGPPKMEAPRGLAPCGQVDLTDGTT